MKLPLLLFPFLLVFPGLAQNLASNSSFELPAVGNPGLPAGWSPSGSNAWETFGRTGSRSVSIWGAANGFRQWFASPNLPVQQGKAYVVRFWARSTNMTRGFLVAGFDNAARRDFLNRPGAAWVDYSFVAWIPSNGVPAFRVGSFDGDGALTFDDVEVLPLDPVHARVGPYRLGVGENLNAGRYEFRSDFAGYGANYSRAQFGANFWFNDFRWYLDPGKHVTFRHELAGQPFTNAVVTVGIQNYNNITSTSLWVEASADGGPWQFVGGLQGTNRAAFALPPSALPATNLLVRLRSVAAAQFALTNYTFAADIPDTNTAGVGETHYWGQWLAPTNVFVDEVISVPEGRAASVVIHNPASTNQTWQLTARATFNFTVRERSVVVEVPAGATNTGLVPLPTAGFGDNIIALEARDGGGVLRLHQTMRHTVSILADDSYGERLPSPTNLPVWWCAGPYKVGETRALPTATNTAAQVAAARNEYEPFQLVLRPNLSLTNVTITVGDFAGLTNGGVIAATNVTVCRAEYVPVNLIPPTERFGVAGNHPDPVVPVTAPLQLGAGTNCPLWITVYVPKEAPAGDYQATIAISFEGGGFAVPVRLRVFDFALTDVTHTRTAYGVVLPYNWHRPTNTVQERAIWELYMQNLARHRISPYYPQWYEPVNWNFDAASQTFTHNFAEVASSLERFLEEYHFTTFKDINFDRELPPIGSVPRFNAATNAIHPNYRPLYSKLMQPYAQFLRERGWIDRVYSYWLDEPKASQYPLARDGMLMVEEMAPEWGRFQTEFGGPTPSLNATIWLPQWPAFNLEEGSRRQAAGEDFWFYFATNPKGPAPNNFIDHPAINHRIRSWYGEKFGFDGEAYYGINYYLGTPNPWTNTMSSTDLSSPPVFYWGNGDGTLVYPPTREPPATNTTVIAGPIDSIRWELIRDGMEDREYFWQLARLLAEKTPLLGTNHPAIQEAEAARAAALAILPWPHIYPYDPEQLLAARTRLAEAIEALDDGAPFIAKEPLNKVVKAGDSERLRVEAVGWPVPQIQWQHQGTNLPGATNAKLSLTNITTDLAGEYRAIAWNSQGSVTCAVGRLTVLVTNMPPVVITHPKDLSRTNGARAVFGAGVSSLTPLTYQWLHNGVPLLNATNVTVVLTNLGPGHAGFYALVASNAFGVATSSPALLLVEPPGGTVAPAITMQPTNQAVLAGETAVFAVTAVGTAPLSYQWYFNATNPVGSNVNPLVLTNVQPGQAGDYRVVVANLAGSVTSAVATLSVEVAAPVITAPPTNLTVVQGQSAQFTVTATGSLPLAYQWFFNETNLLVGATASTLSFTNVQPPQVGSYLVRVTNSVGAVTSPPALLLIAGMPSYTNEPPGLTVAWQAPNLVLTLAPDNRARTIQVSTNLVDWEVFTNAGPSAAFVTVPVAATNLPGRFFRAFIVP